jgi:hypothetical protein
VNNESTEMITESFSALADMPYPSLGIDLDGCVDEAPLFFRLLTNYWPGKVFVLTFRDDRTKAEADLARFNIKFDELILVSSFDAKAEVIVDRGILIYFDDQPEMLRNIPSTVNVMLVRNDGNFRFDEKLWQFSEVTGKCI